MSQNCYYEQTCCTSSCWARAQTTLIPCTVHQCQAVQTTQTISRAQWTQSLFPSLTTSTSCYNNNIKMGSPDVVSLREGLGTSDGPTSTLNKLCLNCLITFCSYEWFSSLSALLLSTAKCKKLVESK